jgi:hypothetical protein
MKTNVSSLVLAGILFSLAPLVAPAAETATKDLSAAAIIKQSQAAYAALNSYRDDGKSVSTLGKVTAASFNFTIQLARTNFYKIVWWQGEDSFTPKGAVWSAGTGDFLWMSVFGSDARKQPGQELALAGATGISGGAAASIPGTFFNLHWGGMLAGAAEDTRLPDAKIDGTDCYVLTHGGDGRTNMLWIGKQDFLIHQIEKDISGTLMKRMMEEQAKSNPQIRASMEAAGEQLFQDTRIVESHRNIVVNTPVTAKDFEYQIPPTKP